MVEPYRAVVIQNDVEMPNIKASASDVKATMRRNLDRVCQLIDWAAREKSSDEEVLIALPESMLHSFPRAGWSVKELLKATIKIPGEETERISAKAVEKGAHIVGHSWETLDEFPERFFSTAFIIDPQGKIILKYRKVQPAFNIEGTTSPHDVMDEYVKRYGEKSLFPVVDTPMGHLGCFICYDGMFPEVTRCLAMNGAEVLIRPTSWFDPTASEPYNWWEMQNRMRASENTCYVVAPNLGNTTNSAERPKALSGNSMIVDYEGRIMARAGGFGEATIDTVLHIDALRYRRSETRWNPLATLRTEAYAAYYQASYYPMNHWKDRPLDKLSEVTDTIAKTIEKLRKRNVIAKKPLPRN
ncbi:MAG: hypothetical protein O6762_02260 [Thaumarchaeota archaeon]|nr:hypothetical protein [Nitrososphaerota archaeon]